MFDPDASTDDFDSPFHGVPDAEWDADYLRTLPPYPAVPAEDDSPEPATWPLLVLAVVAVCSFAIAARLIVEG